MAMCELTYEKSRKTPKKTRGERWAENKQQREKGKPSAR